MISLWAAAIHFVRGTAIVLDRAISQAAREEDQRQN